MRRCGTGPEMFYLKDVDGDTAQCREEHSRRQTSKARWVQSATKGPVETLILPESLKSRSGSRYERQPDRASIKTNRQPEVIATLIWNVRCSCRRLRQLHTLLP